MCEVVKKDPPIAMSKVFKYCLSCVLQIANGALSSETY